MIVDDYTLKIGDLGCKNFREHKFNYEYDCSNTPLLICNYENKSYFNKYSLFNSFKRSLNLKICLFQGKKLKSN